MDICRVPPFLTTTFYPSIYRLTSTGQVTLDNTFVWLGGAVPYQTCVQPKSFSSKYLLILELLFHKFPQFNFFLIIRYSSFSFNYMNRLKNFLDWRGTHSQILLWISVNNCILSKKTIPNINDKIWLPNSIFFNYI